MSETELGPRCLWCGTSSSNCPNSDGESCCLPCYEHTPAARVHANPDQPTAATTERERAHE